MYQSQTQKWQKCWNYQIGDLKQLWLIHKDSNGWSRKHARTDGQCKQRYENSKKEGARYATYQIKKVYIYKKNNVFDGLLSRLELAEQRISEGEHILIETFQMENERKLREKKEKTECLRTMGQLQNV